MGVGDDRDKRRRVIWKGRRNRGTSLKRRAHGGGLSEGPTVGVESGTNVDVESVGNEERTAECWGVVSPRGETSLVPYLNRKIFRRTCRSRKRPVLSPSPTSFSRGASGTTGTETCWNPFTELERLEIKRIDMLSYCYRCKVLPSFLISL